MICTACREDKPRSKFARARNAGHGRNAQGVDYRCKECVNEQAKFSIRMSRSIPLLDSQMRVWRKRHLISEIEYLEMKLDLLRGELRRRTK